MTSRSARGDRAAGTPLRIDYEAFEEAEEDRYHPRDNPSGKIPLNIAENRLGWGELRGKIQGVTADLAIPDWVAGYTEPRGAPEFREAAARFLSRHLTGCSVDPQHLAVSAGATSVIETTSLILGDPGDVAVIPAPSYPVYRQDIGNAAGLRRFDLITHHEPSDLADGPALRIEHLDRAHRDISASGGRFRMLILTTPDNPTGGVYAPAILEEVADWCIDHEIHLAVNEIYGLSLIDTGHPEIRGDYETDVRFVSFANVMKARRSEYLHLWYALSKDLGISGFRVGFAYSLSADFLRAYETLNLPRTVSNHTQWLLGHVLTDRDFMTAYVAANKRRLTGAYALVVGHLRDMDVPYVPARGSLFVWLDLSRWMHADTEEAELGLWEEIFRSAGVLLTPGVGFGHAKRGLFRLVYPCVPREELRLAMTRLKQYLEGKGRRGR
ncbi:MAG: aminotransferase class I/II-fold pyridoxal phosphate-dependent enzyme [Longimicrobiales bacterium]|nr:aminotransferase class I/II-fold pyridoxal phosphate-dependent enzyme [Longimicrobiales bacterium]